MICIFLQYQLSLQLKQKKILKNAIIISLGSKSRKNTVAGPRIINCINIFDLLVGLIN